ncbi:similar to Saccharomyces cerevisiae YOL114C Putative protein of unknown function with similarity to human ICT1 and prokaryotic factors that may function in translation termination [Maudiozyma barnettii]|uniref:Prokaryotic-type class I peptide chain release factors domain-containing protein n=1 Tax=Maudiozyma barnettii TaxID=61262 RepID=A0A8H2VJX7_9SACH|nr:Pth4p [Kazachstania barnettii]CAB4256791.1 similar to Saccharomyces cerevisiae YOL114C Putative protein of unknown function with similarity to human ICT1 and prokaryotic factors that may function in translation termination [Kazachstania barnettii]CAD1785444.1 similar to Saccharomyces cerevisiae YOL114C Putative protein of unknown function with similarity to human ICT1 and prokaryotic factors that may function in translation termination [Kazachstania barnettii]
MIYTVGAASAYTITRYIFGRSAIIREFQISSSLLYSDTNVAKEWVDKLTVEALPTRFFSIRYDRASGPGGQNVNKVNTKCTLTLPNFSKCSLFPLDVREQMIDKKVRIYSHVNDTIVLQSDETRSRENNRLLCFKKLISFIRETCYFPNDPTIDDVRKWDNIRKKSKESRLKEKKFNGEKKKNRKLLY